MTNPDDRFARYDDLEPLPYSIWLDKHGRPLLTDNQWEALTLREKFRYLFRNWDPTGERSRRYAELGLKHPCD
ncbi:hypothetical protein [Conexibacter woesei]|uniref:Uncharacterized protein n=1 Tax=Conexibacter woesei (strain DSM 14684 / CCUG 47730 / CIP 108061 / JCM 11494 / NBRC 100937 / ID131577) TaxID=469383 RepID=D3F5T6_CONWI|nr:hypothetical protein [Conexibacter woesei]ADB52635.1 hypothetical protein Cwoe_4221 [Conexibacter woesei DSM 14684]